MATPVVRGEDGSLVNKCLELCQMLANRGQAFTLTVKVGNDFTFSLDTKEKDQAVKPRTKKSPSTQRRDDRRQWNTAVEEETVAVPDTPAKDGPIAKDINLDSQNYECMHCDKTFKKNNALSIHVGKEHKSIEQLDGANSSVIEEVQTLVCDICGKHFKTKNDLQKHMNWDHETCIYCEKILASLKDLDEHKMKVH